MNMMPAYRITDQHPYQRNNVAFPHCNQPVMEGVPPQINLDPSKSPSAYPQTWPYISGHGYPTSIQFCCGHHRFPGYWTYAPAYPQVPTSLPPMCFSGGYPSYPEPFYVPYAPPPHYPTELPRYEYDKCFPREYHCCGCPNHAFSHNEGKGVKIEEHEPDAEKKVNDAVSPSLLKNYPYPFVWMPPQYMDNKELIKPGATEGDDQRDGKPFEYTKADGQEPKVPNGWLPLDINSLVKMIQDGNGRKGMNLQADNSMKDAKDGKTNPSQQSERAKREFPFPVVWIPNRNMQEGEKMKDQERDSSPKSVKEVPLALDSAPVVSPHSDDASNRSNVKGNDLKVGGADVTRKRTDEINIPIKQRESQKSEPESHEKRVRDIPVKQIEGDVTGRETQTSVKRRSNSPKKTSKLPPVCLRVDPPLRKKSGNGSSRSPSPSKKGSAASTNGASKSSSSSSISDKALEDSKHQLGSDASAELKPKEKTVEVGEISSENKDGEERDGSESHGKAQAYLKLQKDSNPTEDVRPKSAEDHIDDTQSQVTSNASTEVYKDSFALTSMGETWTNGEKMNGSEAERKANDMTKEEAIEAMDAKDAKERKVLSDTEAAAMIQAAYRGFQVRKWEPLKKLKQIAEVREHVTDVRGSLQVLETSSNKQIDEKERVTIGETIMRLLLKLDTIQGLHPSFREMRKSLARELTSLQEKLDSIVAKKSQLQMEDQSMGKLMTPPVGCNGECLPEQLQEEVSTPGIDSSEGTIQESHGCSAQTENAASENSSDNTVHVSQDMMEHGQDQHSIKNGNGNPGHDDEKLHSVAHCLPVDDSKCGFSSSTDQVLSEKPDRLPEETVNEAVSKVSEDEASGCDISEVQPKAKPELEGTPNEANELEMKAWEELPRGVIDDLKADNIDWRKGKKNEIEGEELQISEHNITISGGGSSKMHEMEELPPGLLDDDKTDFERYEETGTTAQVLQREGGKCNTHSLGEGLPIGLLDDYPTDSEKHEETETQAQVPQNAGGEWKPSPITHSLAGVISREIHLDQLQLLPEEQEENQFNGESNDWVEVEYEQDGHKGDGSENAKVESGSRDENDELSVNDGHGVANEDACVEVEEVTVPVTPKEVAVKEEQSKQAMKDVTENKEVLSEQMAEQCVTSPKKDGEMDSDRNLIEENEKLRKMMQKLLEAGNEQLTIISNLTGRVKDLEKKLAKKKRVKTIHCRPTPSKPSFKKASNNQLQDRITEVAM